MISFKIKTKFERAKVDRLAKAASFRNIFHAAASLTKDAKGTIVKSRRSSPRGTPPHTGRRSKLKRAIRFKVDRATQSAVIGPRFSFAGRSGQAHEFGGRYKGDSFPERPFMAPALERALPRFAGQWQGTVGG